MKKEIDAIRAKDIPQGGLTQGQQTQIARNEQRMEQVKFFTNRHTLVHFFFKLVVHKLKHKCCCVHQFQREKRGGGLSG